MQSEALALTAVEMSIIVAYRNVSQNQIRRTDTVTDDKEIKAYTVQSNLVRIDIKDMT